MNVTFSFCVNRKSTSMTSMLDVKFLKVKIDKVQCTYYAKQHFCELFHVVTTIFMSWYYLNCYYSNAI